MNPLLKNLNESLTLEFADKVRKKEQAGNKIIKLQTGDPFFLPPEDLISTFQKCLTEHNNHYSVSRGVPKIRTELSHKLKLDFDVSISPDESILMTNGASHALFIAIATLIDRGDEVIVPSPYWMPYLNDILFCGGVPKIVNLSSETNFKITIDHLKKELTNKTKVLMLNNPTNPTGAFYSKEDIHSIYSFCKSNGLYLLIDEVYSDYVYDETFYSSLQINDLKTIITISSFSKTFAMTGWRLGYIIADKEIINEALKVSQFTSTHASTVVQQALGEYLSQNTYNHYIKKITGYIHEQQTILSKNHKNLIEKNILNIPKSTFYCLLDFRKTNMSSKELSFYFLDKNLSLMPATAFGKNLEGYLRISLASSAEEILNGLHLLENDPLTKKLLS